MAEVIRFWNRRLRRMDTEKVYGDAFIRWIYRPGPSQKFTDRVLARPLLSKIYGEYQSTLLSAAKVKGFIRDFGIDMGQYEVPPGGFRSFNDFFIRKFKPGARAFASVAGALPAFAEARYLAFESIRDEQVFPVKGTGLRAEEILGDANEAKPFLGGPLVIARLCPVDYHRYHFPDEGRTLKSYPVHGRLHSVNPVALRAKGDIFVTNERRVSILETRNFGKLAYVEVGALCVGKIVQSHDEKTAFTRGAEKGYFLFGGSTVILLGERGAWKPDADLLERTSLKTECYVQLGEQIGSRL